MELKTRDQAELATEHLYDALDAARDCRSGGHRGFCDTCWNGVEAAVKALCGSMRTA